HGQSCRMEVAARADELRTQQALRIPGGDELPEEVRRASGSDLRVAVSDEEDEAHARRDRAQVELRVEQYRKDGENGAREPELRMERRVIDSETAATRVADQNHREPLRLDLRGGRRERVEEEAEPARVAGDRLVAWVDDGVALGGQVSKPGPVVRWCVFGHIASAVDEDDKALRLLAL